MYWLLVLCQRPGEEYHEHIFTTQHAYEMIHEGGNMLHK
jgi:hypothetical protein